MRNQVSKAIVRAGISFLFIVFGVWEILQPNYWAGFVPRDLSKFFDIFLLVKLHGAVLVFAGLGIAIGKFAKFFAFLATLIMFEIVVSLFLLFGLTDILIRDIAILIFTLSLFF